MKRKNIQLKLLRFQAGKLINLRLWICSVVNYRRRCWRLFVYIKLIWFSKITKNIISFVWIGKFKCNFHKIQDMLVDPYFLYLFKVIKFIPNLLKLQSCKFQLLLDQLVKTNQIRKRRVAYSARIFSIQLSSFLSFTSN